jgi:hypothetical protein
LLAVYQQTGIMPEELQDQAELPALCRHVWEWFAELSRTRQAGFGASPISYAEIAAWARLTGVKPAAWEVKAIRALDDDLLRMSNAEQDQKAKRNKRGN